MQITWDSVSSFTCFLLKKMADLSCTIVSKKLVLSPVWDYFGLHADNKGKVIDDGVAVC